MNRNCCNKIQYLRDQFCPIIVDKFAARFNCTPVDRELKSMMARPNDIILVGWDRSHSVYCSAGDLLLLQIYCGDVRLSTVTK